jgi:hypothetical protein
MSHPTVQHAQPIPKWQTLPLSFNPEAGRAEPGTLGMVTPLLKVKKMYNVTRAGKWNRTGG